MKSEYWRMTTSKEGFVYTANEKANTISVIDVRRGSIQRGDTHTNRQSTREVGFTPDGGRAYVSLRDENNVAVIDTATQKVIRNIKSRKRTQWGYVL